MIVKVRTIDDLIREYNGSKGYKGYGDIYFDDFRLCITGWMINHIMGREIEVEFPVKYYDDRDDMYKYTDEIKGSKFWLYPEWIEYEIIEDDFGFDDLLNML